MNAYDLSITSTFRSNIGKVQGVTDTLLAKEGLARACRDNEDSKIKGKFDKMVINRRVDRAEGIWNGNLYKRLYTIR